MNEERASAGADPTCTMDDAGQPCGRHLERGECSIHGRAAWPNPDACCLRNAFEDDAHSPTCQNASDYTRAFHGRRASAGADPEPRTEAGRKLAEFLREFGMDYEGPRSWIRDAEAEARAQGGPSLDVAALRSDLQVHFGEMLSPNEHDAIVRIVAARLGVAPEPPE